jgi:hypothetical protein
MMLTLDAAKYWKTDAISAYAQDGVKYESALGLPSQLRLLSPSASLQQDNDPRAPARS